MNQDVSSRLHQEHFEWLTSKKTQQQKKLDATKNLILQHPDFDELKEIIKQLQADIGYCENILKYLKVNFNQQFGYNESQDAFDDEDNDFSRDEADKSLQNDLNQRDPMSMLRPEYQGMPMLDIIESILNDASKQMSNEDVTKIAYDTKSENEFERAKASMSAQLRIGANKGKWLKVGRGCFASNNVVKGNFPNNNFESLSVNNGYLH
ncbi:hypothetical protein H6G04_11160 [Calothrix membranacea FACHB-236]|nr:hypothetical protein [Calothrix membranacea FACHB-236]